MVVNSCYYHDTPRRSDDEAVVVPSASSLPDHYSLPLEDGKPNAMPSSSSTTVIDLPIELEREIFELAAADMYPTSPSSLITFSLVAKRVQIWMYRILYHTVILKSLPRTQAILRTMESRPPSFFDEHVKRLYITSAVPTEEAERVLGVCTGAEELTCWPTNVNWSNIGVGRRKEWMQLRKLSMNAQVFLNLITSLSPSLSQKGTPSPLFPSLTHLDIVNPSSNFPFTTLLSPPNLPSLSPSSSLCLLTHFAPNLQHLSIGDLSDEAHGWCIPLLHRLLSDIVFPELQNLILISRDCDFVEYVSSNVHENEHSDPLTNTPTSSSSSSSLPRLTVIPSFHYPKELKAYWADVARGDGDFWDIHTAQTEQSS